jgi:hypothetical protein
VRRTGSRASRCEPPVTVPVSCSSPGFPTLPGSSQVPRQPAPGGSISTAARPSLAAPGRSSGAASRSTLFLTSPVAGRRAGCRRSWRPSPGSPCLSYVADDLPLVSHHHAARPVVSAAHHRTTPILFAPLHAD